MKNISKKFIVMTSIFAPTEALSRFAQMKDWTVIMVGDKKTPKDWTHDNVIYLSPADQEKLGYEIIKYLPWNLPARAMIGYLYAIEHGAEVITQADDDNIPQDKWGVESFDGEYGAIEKAGFINIYQYFTDKFVWPRGYPLDRILEKNKPKEKLMNSRVGIWQHLADKETDVDAIYRLTNNTPVFFKKRKSIVLAPGAVCPFNCQSTTFRKEIFPLLYLPTQISPRESDIVRSLVAQPLLWNAGYLLGFTDAKVTQERNPHDYLKDFGLEILIYKHSEEIFEITKNTISPTNTLNKGLLRAYMSLIKKGLIPKNEILLLRAWIRDLDRLLT